MQKIVDYVKQYIGVISIVLAVCILLTYSFSHFKINIESKKAAEMYIGELKYTLSIDGTSTNTLTVPSGETIVDINLTNQNEIKTYYKLLYSNNNNISISYYDQTKNTNDEITSYKSPSDSIENKSSNNIKLKIINNSTSSQGITFKVSGGYSTNTLQDVEVPNTYTEITTLETPSTNTYFCETGNNITTGTEYVNGQYTYRYMQEGTYSSSGLSWTYIFDDGWGVQLTDKTSTEPVTSKLCTYINNKPVTSMSRMFYNSAATTLDLSNFDTSKVSNMSDMFRESAATTLDLSNFNTSKVTNMMEMFSHSAATTIDVSNFNTSNVTNMNSMFSNSVATTIDLSNFDTSKVTDMGRMFYNNPNLKTIYASDKFNTNAVTSSYNMFYNSTKLVGGNGTTYNSSYTGKTYARIDGGASLPGYFTLKNN